MAGRGPAPKDPAQRRTRHEPQRGEWSELPPRNPARPPAMRAAPAGGWATGTRAAWKAWWADPASLIWTPAERDAVFQLAMLHHLLERGEISRASEVRLRMDGLGLTPKGKRELRLRVVVEAPADEVREKAASARRRDLRVVI